jgi:glycosyltransferase involved in cell wall biosynthesis
MAVEVALEGTSRAPRRRLRVLFVQPSIQPPGGGNALAAWMIEALRDDYELHAVLLEPPDLEQVNAYYGTHLTPDAFTVHLAPPSWRSVIRWCRRHAPISLDLLGRKLTMRVGAAIERDMDLVISASNEIQSSRPAIQYIHFPWGYWPRPDVEIRWFHRIPGVLSLYYWFAQMLHPVSRAAIARNRTLVNSAWTGRHYRKSYGGESEVLFPPIAGTPPRIPWSERTNDLVALGRIARVKRLDLSIALVDAIRARGHEVGLTIIGSADDPTCLAQLRQLTASRPWISLRTNLTRDEVLGALATHRFGIHSMQDEHFGMAVAEMVLAGCIPFVHADGGPIEIVAGDERLTFRNHAEAADKIVRVLADPALQETLRQRLQPQTELFNTQRFGREIRRIVAEVVEQAGLDRSNGGPLLGR